MNDKQSINRSEWERTSKEESKTEAWIEWKKKKKNGDHDRFTKSTKHPRVAGSWLSKIYIPLSNADKYRPFENNFTVICLGEIETEAFQSLADIRADKSA